MYNLFCKPGGPGFPSTPCKLFEVFISLICDDITFDYSSLLALLLLLSSLEVPIKKTIKFLLKNILLIKELTGIPIGPLSPGNPLSRSFHNKFNNH
jgi:hypothetical protein